MRIWIKGFSRRASQSVIIASLLILATSAVSAGSPVPAINAVKAGGGLFLIDGILNEKDWKNSAKIAEFKQFKDGKPAKERSEAYLLRDDKNLYIGYVCHFSNYAKRIEDIKKKGDKVFATDAVELFIDPGRTGQYAHIAVNMAGSVYESGLKKNVKAAVQVMKDRYVVEIEVPLDAIPMPDPKEMGKAWGINFCRGNPVIREWTCWSPTLVGFHNSARFGVLKDMDVDVQAIYNRQHADANLGDLVVSLDKTFYSDQKNIKVAIRVRSKLLKGTNLTLSIRNSEGKIVFEKKETDLYFTNKFSAPLANLGNGRYSLTVELLKNSGGKPLAKSETSFWKIPPMKRKPFLAEIKNHAMYIDGKLFFPIVTWSWYLEWSELAKFADDKKTQVRLMEERVADLASHGFNAVISTAWFFQKSLKNNAKIYMSDRGYPGQNLKNAERFKMSMNEVLALLEKYGVKMILLPPYTVKENPSDANIQAWSEIVLRYRNDKRVLLWMSADESDGWVTRNKRMYKLYKEVDPCRPVWLNIINAVFANKNTADILSTDPYPIPNTPLSMVSVHADRLKKAIKGKSDKAAWLFLQMYGSKRERKRSPTPMEERCMAYLSLNHGMSGFGYYLYRPPAKRATGETLTEELWQSMTELNRQTQKMAPIYLEGEVVDGLKSSDEDIDLAGRLRDGILYLIACNTKSEKRALQIVLPASLKVSTNGNGVFAKFAAKCENGKIELSLKPYEVKVIKFALK